MEAFSPPCQLLTTYIKTGAPCRAVETEEEDICVRSTVDGARTKPRFRGAKRLRQADGRRCLRWGTMDGADRGRPSRSQAWPPSERRSHFLCVERRLEEICASGAAARVYRDCSDAAHRRLGGR